jgi:hypothetical protein
MLRPLLTPDQVADLIHLSRRRVLELPLSRVRVGNRRGKILFNEEDVRDYLRSKTEYPAQKGVDRDVGGIQKRTKKVGLQVLPSRADLEAIRMGYARGSEKRRGSASD